MQSTFAVDCHQCIWRAWGALKAQHPLQEKNNQDRQAVGRMAQLVERMCHQNIQQDIISDFKVCTTTTSCLILE